jgi:methionyl aminopeptidase
MAVIIKTKEQIDILRQGGKHLAEVVHKVSLKALPGVTTDELDTYAYDLIVSMGDKPAFLNYRPEGAPYAFPKTLCVSVNDEVVHGIPGGRVLKEGDIVCIDCGINHGGLFTDHAVTVVVGDTTKESYRLIEAATLSLEAGIEAIVPGARIGDISNAIEKVIKPYKFGIIKELAGHGVGVKIHEDPYIPNYGKAGTGILLKPGMVIAIEPMITAGKQSIIIANDGWTIKTKDSSRSAHMEHTVLVTEDGAEILTMM